MSDYLSEVLSDNPSGSGNEQTSRARDSKNARPTQRFLEIEGNGYHQFFQYSHFYKATLVSGKLELLFTDDVVTVEGTQGMLMGIAEEVSMHTLSVIRSVDPSHAAVQRQLVYVSSITITTR